MNKVFTILKTGMSCAVIIFVIQAITYCVFAEKFEEYYKYTPFIIVLFKIGIINLIVYLFFSVLIYFIFGNIRGSFLSKSFILMFFFIVFKTIPVVLNLLLFLHMKLSFAIVIVLMNILSDIISAFVFTGMFTEALKIKGNNETVVSGDNGDVNKPTNKII